MFAGSSDPHRSPVTALLGISIFSLRRRVCPQASCRKWLLLCSALSAGLQFIAFRVGFAWPIQATATAPSTPFRQHPIRGTTAYLRFGYAGYIDVAQIRSKPRLQMLSGARQGSAEYFKRHLCMLHEQIDIRRFDVFTELIDDVRQELLASRSRLLKGPAGWRFAAASPPLRLFASIESLQAELSSVLFHSVNSGGGELREAHTMLRVWLLPIAAIAAEVGPVAPPPPLEASPFQDTVVAPLDTAVVQLEQVGAELLKRLALTVSDKTDEDKTLLEMGTELRKALGEVVPLLLQARDNSSAVDIDTRPSNASKATIAQNVLLHLQKYSTWAWPVLDGYSKVAFTDGEPMTADLNMRMQRGTNGSLQYLSSVLTFAWAAAEYQFPVIENLMARNDSSGEVVAKAGCSANYAQLLGDITKVFSDLSNSKIYCFESLTNKTAQRECAQNSIKSLEKVTAAIAEAANAMWQCFGIFWGCSQLMNSAYNKLSQAYYASFKMSSKCSVDKDATCDEDFYAFKALGSLSAAKGLLQSAQQECDIKGGTLEHPLNPWAATPFMPRKDPKSAECVVQSQSMPAAIDVLYERTAVSQSTAVMQTAYASTRQSTDERISVGADTHRGNAFGITLGSRLAGIGYFKELGSAAVGGLGVPRHDNQQFSAIVKKLVVMVGQPMHSLGHVLEPTDMSPGRCGDSHHSRQYALSNSNSEKRNRLLHWSLVVLLTATAMSLVSALVKKFLALEKYFVKDKGIVTPHAGKRSLHVEQGVLNPELLAGLPLKLVDSCVNFDAAVSFKEDQPNRVQSHHGISLEIEVLSSPYNEEGREEALLRLRRRKA
ncbi:hypothetical protein AK812_SmicGene22673 [Symbiodinium microadriaticum]|uniref:Uncharacterized protein n=1 Tax=Symbiodinium microadriaticum TaxID=2951 RepID=A0A1Q9DJ60_SYMMI|nr:hypothetical protein AK812_SmicGene22673 [Symbiodinium microadriaticum]